MPYAVLSNARNVTKKLYCNLSAFLNVDVRNGPLLKTSTSSNLSRRFDRARKIGVAVGGSLVI